MCKKGRGTYVISMSQVSLRISEVILLNALWKMQSTCKLHDFMTTKHQLMSMLECWSSPPSKKTSQPISEQRVPPIPTVGPSTEPKHRLAHHLGIEERINTEHIPPVCGCSYYLPQLISNWNKNKEVIPWNKESKKWIMATSSKTTKSDSRTQKLQRSMNFHLMPQNKQLREGIRPLLPKNLKQLLSP